MAAALAAISIAVAAASCGDEDESARSTVDRSAPPKPVPKQPEPILRGAPRLETIPRSITAGGSIEIRVVNPTDHSLAFGLGNGLERRSGGRWRDITRSLPASATAVPELVLGAGPNSVTGPGYQAGLVDRFTTPRDLEPGTYRLFKEAGNGGDVKLLGDPFTVR